MRQPDLDLRLGHIAVRMGVIPPQELPRLLSEARALKGGAEGAGIAFGQLLLKKKLISASDYLYMARQATAEEESGEVPSRAELRRQVEAFESGDLDSSAFEAWMSSSGEQLTRPTRVTRFGPFELLAEIARGGMGIVYRAKDQKGRVVALKVMIEADDDEIRLKRFEHEAELAAALDHPNIVKIHDAGRVDGIPYFTMDLVDGESLDDLLEGEGIARDKALTALAQVARAMDHAHERGIVHRDLKPGNILLDRRDGRAQVTDFGLARDLQRLTRLTQVGQAVGTPYYMSPEQVRGERDVDGRADIYALGVILYEILTGDVPFDADSPLSLFKKIDREPVVLQVDEALGIDPRIHAITMKALAKDRDQRYARGRHLAEDLERYLKGGTPRALREGFLPRAQDWLRERRGSVLVVGLALAALLVLSTAALLTWQRLSLQRACREAESAVRGGVTAALAAAEGADQALAAGAAGQAVQQAEAALAQLAALETARAAEGEPGRTARAAWEEAQGERALAALVRVRARALASDGGSPAAAESALRQALERGAEPELAALLAELLERSGRFGEALTTLDAALEADPRHPECLLVRARLRLRRGEAVMATPDLSTALMREPKDPRALVLRSEAYRVLGRLDAAQGDAEEARALAPAEAAPWLALGDVARARGLTSEAAAHYAQAARQSPRDPLPHLRLAELHLADGGCEEALAACERAAERAPHDPLPQAGRVRALLGLFRLEEARAAAQAALSAAGAPESGQGRAELLEALGMVEQAAAGEAPAPPSGTAGSTAAARDALARATAAWPQAASARLRQLGLLLHSTPPALEEAEALLQALRQVRPDEDPDLLCGRAALALARSEGESARELAELALAATRGTHPRARRLLARARLLIDRSSPAARAACNSAWAEELAGEDPGAELLRSGLVAGALARAHGDQALLKEARARLLAALRLDPDRPRGWLELGLLALASGAQDEAWEALRRAEALDPWRPEVAEGMGQAALADPARRDRASQAVTALGRAMESAGPTPVRLGLRGELSAIVGRWSDALGDLEEALRLEPTAALEAQRARALEELGRPVEAQRARARGQILAESEREGGRQLLAEAEALRAEEPDAARELLLRAARRAAPARSVASRAALLAAAELLATPVERLECLAPLLLLSDPETLARADALLAAVWETPLAREPRRDLVRRARDGGPAEALAVAVAAFYDALAGEEEAAWLTQGLRHAEQALGEAPASLALLVARAGLRARTGDPARALRGLSFAAQVAPGSPLLLFVSADARLRRGERQGAAQLLEQARQAGLPALEQRTRLAGF